MKIFYIALCLLAIFSISTVEAAKKRKKKSNVSHRPGNIEPYLYCVSCLAVGREILRKVRFDRSEVNIYDALTNICNPNNYMVYHLPPPDLAKGCTAFLNGNEETIVDVLLNTKNMSKIGEVLCYNETQACVGVDLDNPPEIQDEYEVNGVVYTRNKNVTGRGSPQPPEKKELEVIEDNIPVSSEPLEGNLEIPTVPDDVRNKEKEPIKTISDEEFAEENHKKRKINDPQVPRNEKVMNRERAPEKPENHQKVKGIDLEKEQEIGKEKALDIEL